MCGMIFTLLYLALAAALDPLLEEICARAPHVAAQAENWCTEADVCKWAGVACLGRIPGSVQLHGIQLDLELPVLSMAATQFFSVSLTDCGLTGDLASLRTSPSMSHLDLSGNSFAGFVDASLFRSISMLTLKSCGISADVSSVVCAVEPTTLSRLDLSENRLFGDLSSCIGGGGPMDALDKFNVSHNLLTGRAPVPRNVMTYDISHNSFSAIESPNLRKVAIRLPNLIAAEKLYLSRCDISQNKFESALPDWVATTNVCKI